MPELKKEFSCEFLDLIKETSKHIEENFSCVAILGSSKTRNEKIYDKNLEGVKTIYPTSKEQDEISEIILRIISGNQLLKDKIFLENLIKKLIFRGAEKIVFACTDIGNLVKNNRDVIDSTKILIRSIKRKM